MRCVGVGAQMRHAAAEAMEVMVITTMMPKEVSLRHISAPIAVECDPLNAYPRRLNALFPNKFASSPVD